MPVSPPACNNMDFTGAMILACDGFFSGNLLNNGNGGANTTSQITDLGTLGFTWDGSTVFDTISGLNGGNPSFIGSPLSGITFIGIHYGAGGNSPDGTAFFKINAAPGTTSLTLDPPFQATSDLIVYATGIAGGVPEPATWAMMLVGFGGLGVLLRRRRHEKALAAVA